jgi:hypothetical protein
MEVMPQYGWADCPDDIRDQIVGFVETLRQSFSDNLIGVYLHGSLAMGCFNPERSDVDLLVITKHGMSLEQKRAVAEALLRFSGSPRPFEISFLSQAQLHNQHYPPPFDFHYGDTWREQTQKQLTNGEWRAWNDTVRRDPDLPGHFMITTTRGISLYGELIAKIFPKVKREHYLASILGDVTHSLGVIAQNPVYTVLNACRVYWYLREGTICSKDEAGAWALDALPGDHGEVVRQALAVYRGDVDDVSFDSDALVRFAEYVDAGIKALQ